MLLINAIESFLLLIEQCRFHIVANQLLHETRKVQRMNFLLLQQRFTT